MTLGGFRSRGERGGIFNQGSSEPRSPEPQPQKREEPTALTAYIDKGVELAGNIKSNGSVRIDGKITKGVVSCRQTVIIGQAATVDANIEAETAIVSGEVNGDIHARRKITLDKHARVTGNLTTPGIVIEEGARLRGQIMIGAEEEVEAKAEPKVAAEPAVEEAAKGDANERAAGNRPRSKRAPEPSAQI